jgi:isoaspartyl peptidase/L-asparaginase-like protein (Ntn-hydrolase superfamily)
VTAPALAVHGGAGNVRRERLDAEQERTACAGLLRALHAGLDVLESDGSALDAVESAVSILEDEPFFNAGRGSVLNAEGRVSMDAAIAAGDERRAGAVAGVGRLCNPIRTARRVMEDTPHVLLIGEAAERFALGCGQRLAEPGHFVTAARRDQLERAQQRDRVSLDHDESSRGTVGAVARDSSGHLAAATSTGGMTNQLPGRVGDSPLVGAGTWADDSTCAVSATGHGEAFMRSGFAHEVDARLRLTDTNLVGACERALARVAELGSDGGCIAIAPAGPPVLAFNTSAMFRGWIDSRGEAQIRIFADDAARDADQR